MSLLDDIKRHAEEHEAIERQLHEIASDIRKIRGKPLDTRCGTPEKWELYGDHTTVSYEYWYSGSCDGDSVSVPNAYLEDGVDWRAIEQANLDAEKAAEDERKEAEREKRRRRKEEKRMKLEAALALKPGDRIRLLEMPDDPAPIEAGSEGTVTFVTDLSKLSDKTMFQIGVDWDSGRVLSLVERDKWEKVA